MTDSIVVDRAGSPLVGERWPGGAAVVVLLHPGVADRRCWTAVAEDLAGALTVVAYDRRGFGQSPPADGPFSHVDDLIALLDRVDVESAWLVGNSMGGGLALDTALSAPERVSGLVLIAPAVSGAPEPDLDAEIAPFEEGMARALAAGNLDEINRLETWLWLDGPAGPEGRVGGESRRLPLAMNELILCYNAPEEAGASGVDAWSRVGEVQAPVTVACGDLDASFLVQRSRDLARRLPGGRHRVLEGVAHLPSLEQPALVTALVTEALASA